MVILNVEDKTLLLDNKVYDKETSNKEEIDYEKLCCL